MIDYTRVGHRIRTLRRLSDITLEEVMEKTGFDYRTISEVERGVCTDYKKIDAICRVLNMETDYVLDPRNKEAETKVWGNLSDEELQKLRRVAEMLQQKNGPGA